MNSISRTIGLRDIYPFILSPAVIGKLGFIHDLLQRERLSAERLNSEPDMRRSAG
jgi:hypothetical protein